MKILSVGHAAIVVTALAATCLVSASAYAQSPTTLRINLVLTNQDPQYPVYEQFAADLEGASNGTLKVEVFPSEALGKAVDAIDSISRGAPILQQSDFSQWANYAQDYSVFMSPYLFDEPQDCITSWKSDLGHELDGDLQSNGLRVVTNGYFGTRHLLSNRQITTRSDAEGMKIRNAPTKMWNEVSRVLGGNSTNTAWSEAYSALEQGVADGVESPLTLLYSSRMFEVRPYISLTGHLVACSGLVMSQATYESLPPDAQKAIDEVGTAFAAIYTEKVIAAEQEYKKLLEDAGIVFNDVDRDSFMEAASTVPTNFPEWSPGLYERAVEAVK